MNGNPLALPRRESLGELELVAESHDQMWTGVTVSHGGRIFVSYPRWGDRVEYTVPYALLRARIDAEPVLLRS